MTLYEEIVAAGIPVDHHESDLYVPDTPEVRAILTRHARTGAGFVVQDGHPNAGQVWLDVPFAYDPWWKERLR